MNKTFLKRIALGLGVMAIAGQAGAQKAPITTDGNHAVDYVGTRFSITSPASIAGIKQISITNDSSDATTDWGAFVRNPFVNVQIVKAYDTLGASALQNGTGSFPSLTGKVALIFRGGGITFTQKAYNCELAGAVACIIINNEPGGPVGMANTASVGVVHIPVMMVSDVDGNAINSSVKAGNTVTMSLSRWGYNAVHDLGILPDGVALGHAYSIPAAQLAASNGNPDAYKMHSGAFIGNFGTAASETGVKLKNMVTFTPTGGSASMIKSDSVTIGTFNAVDSILIPTMGTGYDIHATGNGRFDQTYTLTMSDSDYNSGDNSITASMYVTDSIFCKSRYDFAAGKPLGTRPARFASGDSYVFGPLFYVAKGGYQMRAVQMAVAQDAATPSLNNRASEPLLINVFGWKDANGDHLMSSDELSLVGLAQKNFDGNDSNYKFFTADITNPTDNTKGVVAASNTWYWVAPSMPGDLSTSCDVMMNYFPRSYVRHTTENASEFYAPIFDNQTDDVLSSATGPLMMPFEPAENGIDSSRYANQKGIVPAIALHMSKNTVPNAINNVTSANGSIELFPNPAAGIVNVAINLNQPSSHVSARINDAMGRTVRVANYSNVQKQTIQLPVNDLAAGQYYMVVSTDRGPMASKFTVVGK